MAEEQKEAEQQQQDQRQGEQDDADQRAAPSGKVVYKTILKEGEEELRRPSAALFWSGLAAGLSMGFSMVAEALLSACLPDAPWRPLVAKFGYSVGFLIVVLGRQQLFTENTLTPILPLLQRKQAATMSNILRLWGIVLLSNLLGALVFAFVAARTNAFDPNVRAMFAQMGNKAMEHDFLATLLRGVFAGWLIALMVWLLPFAETARVWVIVLITYVVGLAHFSHIIAGSVETFTLAAMGQVSWLRVVTNFLVPALTGNILGGVTLVAILNHGQVVAGGNSEDL